MMAMHLCESIRRIDAAEELFALLDVAFDPAVLTVHRIAILQRFGQEFRALERRRPPLAEDERRPLYAAALQRIHALYAQGGSDIEPLFRPRPRDLVSAERLRHAPARASVT